MMGYQHACGGAAAWLASVPAVEYLTGPLTPGQIALGFVLGAGGGILPDLDQHGSTVARTYGPVTNVIARLVALAAGGHRNGTHSLLGLTVVALVLTVAAATVEWVTVWLLLGIGIRGLRRSRHPWYAMFSLAFAAGAATILLAGTGVDPTVPLVAGGTLGAVSHVALDCLTPQRCPLLWPFSKARHGVGLVTTGSRWTSPLVTTALTGLVGVLAWMVVVSP